jgi:hypothetical protein
MSEMKRGMFWRELRSPSATFTFVFLLTNGLLDLNDNVIAQVRQAADIVDFVGQVTPLKLAGKSYKGLCPFHREKTPSFTSIATRGSSTASAAAPAATSSSSFR